MSSTTIGIKIANRTYVPILEKGVEGRKRVILTTVRDGQRSVQIDLYENDRESLDTAQYVGSLLIENMPVAPAGEAEVELVLGLDDTGTLTANASEAVSGESQSLSVSLESLAEESIYDITEFELDDELDFGLNDWEDTSEKPSEAPDSEEEHEPVGIAEQEAIVERRRPVMLGLFIAVGVIAAALVALLLFVLLRAPKVPPLEARIDDGSTVGESSPVGGGPATAPVADGGAAGSTVTAAFLDTPRDDELGGVWYWVRWGDTLWSLSASFYRNPWLYGEIAAENRITNPDRIYAGSRIYIPSR